MTLRTDRPGIALLVVMLLTLVVAAIAAGAALIGANSFLINEYDGQSSLLESVADAGLELGRARLNANPGLYNDTLPAPLEYQAAVYDADGAVIPGIVRTVYAMPLGGGLSEYGNFAALVAIAEMPDGAKAVRRLDLIQSSFASYAYFTDFESADIRFQSNDQLYGPVHSNSHIKIGTTGATFHGPVTTAGTFQGAEYATFMDDTTSGVTPILMPTTSQITRLRDLATPGNLAFTAPAAGNAGQAGMCIEFVSRNIDGRPVGFIKVYTSSSDPGWVTGNVPTGGMTGANAINCGHFHSDGLFVSHAGDASRQLSALRGSGRRCYLGGADSIWGGTFRPSESRGSWMAYPGTVDPLVAAQPDATYLFPLDRSLNGGFRGVIFVDGRVAVSGTVRGRVTLAATDNIVIADDIRYHTDPASGTCEDMLGLMAQQQVIVADNMLNAPRQPASGESYYTYDDSPTEFIHASILALDQFTVQNPGSGATTAEPCNGVAWGRGCLAVTGGLVQDVRGIVAYSNGTGYIKRYTHDTCTFASPPPYFPSTGHFWHGRYHEVDPVGFDINTYFEALN